jgi:orotate phosphoribosyltransferase
MARGQGRASRGRSAPAAEHVANGGCRRLPPTPAARRSGHAAGPSGALLEGHFLLSSGLHSPRYVQCAKLLELPVRAQRVGERLAALLRPLRIDSIVSPALGGLIIGHEVASALDVPFRFTERKDGKMELRRGFALGYGERVAVVEDVGDDGQVDARGGGGGERPWCRRGRGGAILDRSGGKHPFTVPFVSLLTLDFPAWPARSVRCARPAASRRSRGSRA